MYIMVRIMYYNLSLLSKVNSEKKILGGQTFVGQTGPKTLKINTWYSLNTHYPFIGGPNHMYSGSKSGSKSFDELDDLLSASEKNKKPKKSKTMSSENTSRHSCDELMMTRSLHEAETSDTGSQVSIFSSWWVCKQTYFLDILKKYLGFILYLEFYMETLECKV